MMGTDGRWRSRGLLGGSVAAAGLGVLLMVAGCGVLFPDPSLPPPASIPASVLRQGKLYTSDRRGVLHMGDAYVIFDSSGRDAAGPWAGLGFGLISAREPWVGGEVHVGESLSAAGLGTVTLVSFNGSMREITILYVPDPLASVSPGVPAGPLPTK